ncbi:MAG: choice-of-anchor E domain-containing protein [Methanothrix sp.]|nr:choice-of-anchor E domain-containing protein [Methanothrix sp.]
MINIRAALILILFVVSAMEAGAEDIVFCDSVQLQSGRWAGNLTIPRFDPNLGSLKAVEMAVDANLSQRARVENTGSDNSTINSSTESVLTLLLPDAQEIKANASLTIFRELQPFDGLEDFSGRSGMDITKSSSSGKVTYSFQNISGFVESWPGEKLILPGTIKSKTSKPSIGISGSASSQVQTKIGANVCVSYEYEAGEH